MNKVKSREISVILEIMHKCSGLAREAATSTALPALPDPLLVWGTSCICRWGGKEPSQPPCHQPGEHDTRLHAA